MSVSGKDVRRIFVGTLLLLLAMLAFLVIRPILLSIVGGLLLAYILSPLHTRLLKVVRWPTLAASLMCVIVGAIIIVPLWFLTPIMVQQIFEIFNVTQNIDFTKVVSDLFPKLNQALQTELATIIIKFIGSITSTSIQFFVGFVQNLPELLLNLAVVLFVFFFTLRDKKIIAEFVSGISPFKKDKEAALVKQFKETTSSIIYGYVLVGIIQGVALGVGLLIFGVPRALTLTIVGVFASMIPMAGPWLVWLPIAAYLLISGSVNATLAFTAYNIFFVSAIDNILRPYIVARKTGTSSALVLIGMIGGLFVFGFLGIILGPLIIAYLILFLRAYKDGTLSDMFSPFD
jgi:predicted PurR-regulated permease PerM